MSDLLASYAVIQFSFFLWSLLDAWGVKFREVFWKKAGYDRIASKHWCWALLTVFYSAMLYYLISIDKLILLPFVVLLQQAGKEDFQYWILSTLFFGKDWSFGMRGRFLGITYPRLWPWLDEMPLIVLFSGMKGYQDYGEIGKVVPLVFIDLFRDTKKLGIQKIVTQGGLVRSVCFAEFTVALVFVLFS